MATISTHFLQWWRLLNQSLASTDTPPADLGTAAHYFAGGLTPARAAEFIQKERQYAK